MNPASVPVRFSELRQLAKSPAHYLDKVQRGRDFGGSPAYRFGRLVHYLVLGGEYAVYDGTRRGKVWDAFQVEHSGDDIFTRAEYDKARPVADAVLAHPDAVRLLEGEHEAELAWKWLGRDCAGRLDVSHPTRIVDLKTCADAHPDRFQRQAIRYGYHAQMAWYRHGAQTQELDAGSDMRPRDCYIIAAETAPPYPIVVHHLTEAALEQGERLCRLWMENLLNCERSGHFPGYVAGVIDFDVPDEETTLIIDGDEVAA